MAAIEKSYLLREIPAALWLKVRTKARRDGYTLRGLILLHLQAYADGRLKVLPPELPADRRRP